MPISALVDLVVRGREADGAVVVALLRWARRHFLCCVDGVNSSFLGALCLPLCDPLSPDFAPAATRPAFFMTDAKLPEPESGEPHRYRPASEALVFASVLLHASTGF